MPITIKSTELKYKNPSTGQYQGIDAVAERTTSEQCALIEAKGAETIASIPSDYTTLANDVSDLRNVTALTPHTVEVKTGLDVQGAAYCYTIGKICFLVLRNVIFANAGNQQLLISGIPTPAFDQNSIATAGEGAAQTALILSNTGTVSTNGNVYFNILPNTTSYRHWINFIYLTA